jgi:hypothetical protein
MTETVASEVDRRLGAGVQAALLRWQRRVDGGAAPRAAELMAAVQEEAIGRGLEGADLERALDRLQGGLAAYAEGPWPRRATLFLEQPVRHRLEDAGGFAADLRLRVDRVVRYRRQVAILDFKTVSPHAFELAVDRWQLLTYALAAPELIGVPAAHVKLFLVDLRSGEDIAVRASPKDLDGARRALLGAARGIAMEDFGVDGHPDRPCWACGFRQACPSSLARA